MPYVHYDARGGRVNLGVAGVRGGQRRKRKPSPVLLEPLNHRRWRQDRRRNRSSEEDEEDEEDGVSFVPLCYAYPPMAMVCLPSFGYIHDDRDEDVNNSYDMYGLGRRHEQHPQRACKRYNKVRLQSRRRPAHSSSSPHKDDDTEVSDHGIRSQRVHSLQAMARVQRNAARLIQQEFRFCRNRKRNRSRQLTQLHAHAEQLLDSLLRGDMLPSLVSDTLLDVMREGAAQRVMGQLSGETALSTFSLTLYHELLEASVRDVFQVALDSMVREYMMSRVDLSRLSQPSSHVVAEELLIEWIVELVAEIIPDALSELALSYITGRRQYEFFESLIAEELRDVAVEAATELTLAGMLDELTLSS